MPESSPPPATLAGLTLAEIATLAGGRRLPPVASWNPPHCGTSGMRIAADGTWFHQEAPITRPAMVRLFASLLRRESDGYVLVTPVEKLDIMVDDLPFVAVEVATEGLGAERRLAFRLNTDEAIVADAEHQLDFSGDRPALHVRSGLFARLARPVYYELAEAAMADADHPAGLWSGGRFFALDGA